MTREICYLWVFCANDARYIVQKIQAMQQRSGEAMKGFMRTGRQHKAEEGPMKKKKERETPGKGKRRRNLFLY